MPSLAAAGDEVRRRSAAEVGELWRGLALAHPDDGSDSIRERIQSTLTQDQLAKGSVFKDLDLPQIALREMLLMCGKGASVARSLHDIHASGRYTIAAFNAFHGSLFAARTLVAIFGVFTLSNVQVGGRNINLLVDIFPWLGAVDQRKKFVRAHGQGIGLYRAMEVKHRVEHRNVWALLSRIFIVAEMTSLTAAERKKIASFEYRFLSLPRNSFIYDGPAWTWKHDRSALVGRCFGLRPSIPLVELLELAEIEDYPEFLVSAALFSVVERLLREMFPGQFTEEGEQEAVLPGLLFGQRGRDETCSQPPLLYVR